MPRKPKLPETVSVSRVNNKLTNTQQKNDEASKQLADIVAEKMLMLLSIRKRGKVDLNNLDDVEAVTMVYLDSCRTRGYPPNFEGLASALGYSRQNLYHIILTRHDEVSVYLDNFRTLCADIIQTASSKRLLDNATSIFILKSMSGLGFTDKNDGIQDDINFDEYGSGSSNYKDKYKNLIDE